MVRDRLADGPRIAQLLASELTVEGGWRRSLAVEDARPDLEPSVDGTFAYAVTRNGGETVAEVYVQPDRAYVEFVVAPEAVAAAGRERGLRVRPKAVRPPRTLAFLEDASDVKRALDAFRAVASPA
ncbi:MAG: hypothetical protein V5A46_10010 [Haloferacaceae archaeon]